MKRAIQLGGFVWLFTALGVYADQNKPKNPPPPKSAQPSAPAKVEAWKAGGASPEDRQQRAAERPKHAICLFPATPLNGCAP